MKRKIHLKKRVYYIIIILIAIIVFIFSSINVIKWLIDSYHTRKITNDIEDIVDISEIEDSNQTEIIPPGEVDKSNPYWDYIKMNLLEVDFKELKKVNSDIVAWVSVNGTNINYPVVQSSDNYYYLNHSVDKSYNQAGWVFMDYRNQVIEKNKNTIFYAHGRLDNTMFGSLKRVLDYDWYQNTNNHIVRISTESENSLWQVFSVYKIQVTNDYIQTSFKSDKEYLKWLEMLQKRSIYSFPTTLMSDDRIITLSTCLNDQERVVLHAKVIKREAK